MCLCECWYMLVAGNGNEAKILFAFNNCYNKTLWQDGQNIRKKKMEEKNMKEVATAITT